jgi:hypothetical protein
VINRTISKNKIPIRLTDERWAHITEEHCELAGMRLEILDTIENPERVLMGGAGELMAIRKISSGKNLVVIYRELKEDGFVITAFMTSKTDSLNRRKQLWPN